MINYTKNRDSINNRQDDIVVNGHRLKEVKITATKIVKGSQNLNGAGNADLVLDEKDMEKAGKKSWLQLLQEKVKGFREGTLILQGNKLSQRVVRDHGLFPFVTDGKFSNVNQEWYFIDDQAVKFIIDGISIFQLLPIGYSAFSDIDNFLKSHNAEDIKGIEVMSSLRYSAKYKGPQEACFIEITTRSGNGPIIQNTPGIYLYKPLAVSWPKQYYKPRYAATDTIKYTNDLRSTIDWEQNIITDKNGKATVSFYAAGKPTTYTVIIEGTDLNGNLCFKTAKIRVGKIH